MRKFRNVSASLALLFTVNAFSTGNYRAEFDPTQEKQCYEELKAKGCASGEEENLECAELRKKELSKNCQTIQAAKKLSM